MRGNICKLPGSYLLLIYIDNHEISFSKYSYYCKEGLYAYIGSHIKNVIPRIKRHFKKCKRIKWHIDYITVKYKVIGAFIFESNEKIESSIARLLRCKYSYIPNFGATDVKDKSHLFYVGNTPNDIINLLNFIMQIPNKIKSVKNIYWYCNRKITKI